MSVEASQCLKISAEASADLSASQYCFVSYDANGRVQTAQSATDTVIGVLQNKPKALGQMAEVVVIGVTKLIASDTSITQNCYVGPAAATTGKAIKVTPTTSSPTKNGYGIRYQQPGFAANGASAANEVVMAVVNCISIVPGT